MDLWLQAAYRMISHLGGKLMLFCSAACTLGIGPTKNRDAPAHYNSDRESGLRNPADPFFSSYANECNSAQVRPPTRMHALDKFRVVGISCVW